MNQVILNDLANPTFTSKLTQPKMNPWQMQDKLMEISDQARPTTYELNKTSFLYAALILEEVSELMEGLEKVLAIDDTSTQTDGLYDIIRSARQFAHDHSLEIRDELKAISDFNIPLTVEEVIELADATTDITVVNCGFAIASGIDGNACYEDVAGSNLSKANPKTGIIDKDASGKWIKGFNYMEPNLKAVLFLV